MGIDPRERPAKTGGNTKGSSLGRRFFFAVCAILSFAVSPSRAASDGQLAETLLAAAPSPHDIGKASALGGWWPEPPEFLGRLDPATGLRTLILQSYRQPEQGTRERIMLAISAYVSREAASARFNDMEPQDARLYGQTLAFNALGREQSRLHASIRPRGQTLRVQEGRYIIRVTHWTDGPSLPASQMAHLANLTLERLGELEQEKRPLPAQPHLAHLLPSSTEHLGPAMGTAAGPVEWVSFNRAEGENLPDRKLRDFLAAQMKPKQVALRRWPLNNAPGGQVVDAMMFKLTDATSAKRFMDMDKTTRAPERLKDAPLADIPSYLEMQSGERGSRMTLVAAKGKIVAILSCGAPYFYAAGECRQALVELTETLMSKAAK